MDFLDRLAQISQISDQLQPLVGRKESLQFAIATDSEDPEGLRRIRMTNAEKAGLSATGFAMRALPCPYWDPPMPSPGMSVPAMAFDGNRNDSAYLGSLLNETNPPFAKADPINDDWRRIPGDATLEITKNSLTTIGEDATEKISGAKTLLVSGRYYVNSESSIEIEAGNGFISIDPGQAVTICLGNTEISVTPAGVNIQGRLTVNGVDAMVVGGRDSDNDTMIISGQ